MEELKELHLHRLFTVSRILAIKLEVEFDNRLLYSCDAVGSQFAISALVVFKTVK